MAIKVRIPEALRGLTGGAAEVALEATNVRELIDALEAKHAGIKARICDESGKLRRFVNIFVAEEDIRFQNNLDTAVSEATEVSILPAIAGGAARKKAGERTPKKTAPLLKTRRVYLTFSRDLVTQPVIYQIVKRFDVIPNIRGASVTEEMGILSLELQGSEDALEQTFAYLRKEGVKVDPIEMNVVEP